MAAPEKARPAEESESPVLAAYKGAVCTITLNRPAKLNSFNEFMHQALQSALDEAIANRDVRALILTGAGRGFCAGQDLTDRTGAPGSVDLQTTLERLYNPLVLKLRSLPFPVIAAVNGVAAGAGANLALACDIVVAARSAKFIQSFSKIGLIPDSGGTWTLPRLVGRGKAFALAALSETVSADEAEKLGMIWKAVGDDELMPTCEAIAAQLAGLPTKALVRLRELFDAAEMSDLKAQLERERKSQGELGASSDYAEGVRAFFEKRAPKYSPR